VSNLSNTSDEILASARNLIMSGGYNGFSYAETRETSHRFFRNGRNPAPPGTNWFTISMT